MGPHFPKVFVIVLNWNGMDDTSECLGSLSAVTYPNYEVLLVDNNSTDGSVQYFRDQYPEIDIIANEANLGFAEGNNVGIRRAMDKGADYVLLLNNDTVVGPDFIDMLVTTAESDPRIGLVGPKICFYSDPDKVWAIGGTINLFTGTIANRGEGAPQGEYKGVMTVDYVTGCALLIKSQVIKEIGLLNNDYFLYLEDADWNVRAHKLGYTSVINCDVSILHKSGASAVKVKDSNYYYMARNIPLFVKNNGAFYHKLIFYPLFIVHYSLVFIYHLIAGRRQRSIYILRGIKDMITKKYGALKD